MICMTRARVALRGWLVAMAVAGAVLAAWPAAAQEFQIDRIVIEGNQRLDEETIRSYLTVEEGTVASAGDINDSLRALNESGVFNEVSIEPRDGVLAVRVTERPFISEVSFEGNQSIADDLISPVVQSRSRTVFSPALVEEDALRIVDAYSRSGRLGATVVPKVIEREENRVDVVFEIDEGSITRIRKISFIGNRAFSDSRLRGVIESREAAWFRIFTSTDRFDQGRVEVDKEALVRYYTGRGYADFRVLSAVPSLSELGSGFVITFTLDEGPRYAFGDVRVVSEVPSVDPGELEDLLVSAPGDVFDSLVVERTVGAMIERLETGGALFLTVVEDIRKDRDARIVNVDFRVRRTAARYVERIEIEGNVRTLDSVIRREFNFAEGDPLSAAKLAESRRRVRRLGFFDQVEMQVEPTEQEDKVVVRATVQERSTGSLSFGAGYSSSSKGVFTIALSERNLLGKGQRLRFEYETSETGNLYDIGFTEPRLFGANRAGGFDFYRQEETSSSSYDLNRTGFTPRLTVPVSDNATLRASYTFEQRVLDEGTSDISPLLETTGGSKNRSTLGYRLTWDRRDDPIFPGRGWLVSVEQDLSGLGGDVKLANAELSGRYFTPLDRDEKVTGILTGRFGAVTSLGSYELEAADRFFLGGSRIRGFASRGLGPRDPITEEALGGKYYALVSGQVLSSFPFPEETGIRTGLFFDYGTLFGLDTDSYLSASNQTVEVDSEAHARASTGIVFSWFSPAGPMQFIFSRALLSQDEDETESFRFTVGAPF